MDIDKIIRKILEIDDLVSKKHTHSNKSIIDSITQSLIDNWNAAYTHISDAVKHITSTERTNWNDANSKKHTHSNKTILDSISQTNLNNWDDKYSRNEVDNKINQVVSNMDWKEAVTTFSDLAITYPTPEDGWTVNVKDTDITYRYDGSAWISISANSIPLASSTVDGKMSKSDKSKLDGIAFNANNYVHPANHPATMITEDATHRFSTDTEKSNWNDANSKKHTHNNGSILDSITQALMDTWSAAYTHISDTIKHITSDERSLWNTVSNKVDKITGKSLSTNDFDNNYKTKIDGVSSNANKVEASTTNGNIKIDSIEKTVYTHPSGTNPHGTTKADVGLSNVDNTSDLNKPISTAVQNALNGKANSSHTHDDRYYTEAEADSKFATKNEISIAGYGDMLKSVYDTNNDGIIDIAESIQKYISTNSSSSYSGQYTKIASVSITTQYKDANAIIDITSTGSGNSVQSKGTLYFRVKQQNALGSVPYIDLKIVNSEVISNNNFIAVITVNTTSITTVELYYKAAQSYDALVFVPLYSNNVTFYSNQTFLASLPTGMQVSCSNLIAFAASKLATARNIAIAGAATGSANFDGSGNISIDVTVMDDSHNHIISNVDGLQNALNSKTPFATLSATTPATAQWYRIATSEVNIGANSALFKIDFNGTGVMGSVLFRASCHNGVAGGSAVNQLAFTTTNGTLGLTQVRIVYNTTPTGNYAYVEVYNPTALAINYVVDLIDSTGWILIAPNTVGSIPTGYTSESLVFDTGFVSAEDITATRQLKSNIASGTAPLVVVSTTVVPNLNVDLLDGFHASQTAGAANTVVVRDSSGYIKNTWFNSNRGSENTAAAQYLYDTGDGFMRKKDLANVRSELVTTPFGLGGLAIDISSQDCNNIVNTGFYRGNNCTNRCPGSHTWTYLLVIGHDTGSWISQIGINYNNDGTYIRTKVNGTWTAWRRLDATATSQITNDSGFITASASITGNAATATKLQTARAIGITGAVVGSTNFDGSGNISIDVTLKTGLTWNDLKGV